MSRIQSEEELNIFYSNKDPWNYDNNIHDKRRARELLSLVKDAPKNGRTLDIGCGNGFLTYQLPGREIIGVDLSERAIEFAKAREENIETHDAFSFIKGSILELDQNRLGRFDLITITGVLYPQYIGKAMSVVRIGIDNILNSGGMLASCHINEWHPPSFPYHSRDTILYSYRNYTHRLETYIK